MALVHPPSKMKYRINLVYISSSFGAARYTIEKRVCWFLWEDVTSGYLTFDEAKKFLDELNSLQSQIS